jgi:hypothetical protein
MKNALVITAATAFLTSVMVTAFAQDAGAGAGAGVKVETPAVGVKVGADVQANANAGGVADQTYGSVVSSVAGSADVDLSTVAEDANITIVLLSSLQGNAATEAAALDEALTANAEAVTKLHTNIAANAAIKAKLEADGHTADDVVAVKSNADGLVIVYVDDRT